MWRHAGLQLADGGLLGFDRLLLAPGAAPRTLRLPGGELDGVVTLRTFEDADAIRARAQAAARVLVVGGGWIGCEVAASLRQLGCQVTLALPRERHRARGSAPMAVPHKRRWTWLAKRRFGLRRTSGTSENALSRTHQPTRSADSRWDSRLLTDRIRRTLFAL